MKLFLRLEHQLEVVDYQKPNFIHADLSPEGMKKAMKDRGDDQMTIVLGVIAPDNSPWAKGPYTSTPMSRSSVYARTSDSISRRNMW